MSCPEGGGGASALARMTELPSFSSRVTHTLGKVPVGGGGPGFPSLWQPDQTNNTAGWALEVGQRPVQPGFLWPALGETGGLGRGSGGHADLISSAVVLGPWALSGRRKLLWNLSLLPGSPQDRQTPYHSHQHSHGSANHLSCCSSPCPFYAPVMPHLSLVPLPQGPGSAAPHSPLPPLLGG